MCYIFNMNHVQIDIKDDNLWYSSCCKTPLDRRAIIYFSRLTVSFIIIIFCIYQLIMDSTCDNFSRYMSLLTFIIGLNFPALRMGKE